MAAPRRGVDLEGAARLAETTVCDPCDTEYRGSRWLIRITDQKGKYVEWSVGSYWCALEGPLRAFGAWSAPAFLIKVLHLVAARLEDMSNSVLESLASGETEGEILKGGLN